MVVRSMETLAGGVRVGAESWMDVFDPVVNPTILAGVTAGMDVWRDEAFGPVALRG